MSSYVVVDGKITGVSYLDDKGVRKFKSYRSSIPKELIKEVDEEVYMYNSDYVLADIKRWCNFIKRQFTGEIEKYEIKSEVKDSGRVLNSVLFVKIRFNIGISSIKSYADVKRIQRGIWDLYVKSGLNGRLHYEDNQSSIREINGNIIEMEIIKPLIYCRTPITSLYKQSVAGVYLSIRHNICGTVIIGGGGLIYILDKNCTQYWLHKAFNIQSIHDKVITKNLNIFEDYLYRNGVLDLNFMVLRNDVKTEDFEKFIMREYKKTGFKNICLVEGTLGERLIDELLTRQ